MGGRRRNGKQDDERRLGRVGDRGEGVGREDRQREELRKQRLLELLRSASAGRRRRGGVASAARRSWLERAEHTSQRAGQKRAPRVRRRAGCRRRGAATAQQHAARGDRTARVQPIARPHGAAARWLEPPDAAGATPTAACADRARRSHGSISRRSASSDSREVSSSLRQRTSSEASLARRFVDDQAVGRAADGRQFDGARETRGRARRRRSRPRRETPTSHGSRGSRSSGCARARRAGRAAQRPGTGAAGRAVYHATT